MYFEVEIKARPGGEAELDELRASIKRRVGLDSGNLLAVSTPRERPRLEEISIGAEATLEAARAVWPRVELDSAAERAAARWYPKAPWLVVSSYAEVGPAIRTGAITIASAINPRHVAPFFSAKGDTGCIHPGWFDPEDATWGALSELDDLCEELRLSIPAVQTMETWEIVPLVEGLDDRFEEGEIFRLEPPKIDRWLDDQPHGGLYRAATAGRRWMAARWLLFWASHGHRVYYAG